MVSWPHAPSRRIPIPGAYIVTAATYHKQPLFADAQRLGLLQSAIFRHAYDLDWKLQAWAIFPNHYHFVADSPAQNVDLRRLIKRIHGSTARELNALDGTPGRQVWYRYWDTHLTFEKSYFARLAYVHNNAVHHGIVTVAEHYPFCSAPWFTSFGDKPFVETVMSFKTDRVNIIDDF